MSFFTLHSSHLSAKCIRLEVGQSGSYLAQTPEQAYQHLVLKLLWCSTLTHYTISHTTIMISTVPDFYNSSIQQNIEKRWNLGLQNCWNFLLLTMNLLKSKVLKPRSDEPLRQSRHCKSKRPFLDVEKIPKATKLKKCLPKKVFCVIWLYKYWFYLFLKLVCE